jgi:DNA-binding transcriptional ArsR family regulator
VLDLRRLRPAFEIGFCRRSLGQEASHGLDLLGPREMRRAGNRDLRKLQIRTSTDNRYRLQRLCAAPEVGDEHGVAGRNDDLAAAHGDGVNPVSRFDEIASGDLDDDRIHARSLDSASRVSKTACERSGFFVCSAIIDRLPDYELDDVLVVEEPEKLRALGDVTRGRIIALLNQRAASTTELATALSMPKGTVGHHVKVLEKAGLVRVVRTRKVRALTERYYGRVARLFVLKAEPEDKYLPGGALTAMMLRQAAEEAVMSNADEGGESAIVRLRLRDRDYARFHRRLVTLLADVRAAEDPSGDLRVLAFALFRSGAVLPPPEDDA